MAAHLIATMKGGTLDQYDEVSAAVLKPRMPAGLLHHVCVPIDDGFMVIETWASEQAMQDFTGGERFQTAVASSGMPNPEIEVRPVHNVETGNIG
jgi:quinol monooxygenase YgiN